MKTRAITAFFFTIVMLASLYLGAWTFTVFYLLLSFFALREFYILIEPAGIKVQKITGLATHILIFGLLAGFMLFELDLRYLLLIIPACTAFFLTELYRHEPEPFRNIAFGFGGLFFVTIPFCFFYALAFLLGKTQFTFHFPLAFLLMLWASDTGAYLFGRKLGKHKLFERHSPKKTWEGFFGGVLTSVLVSFIISLYFTELSFAAWAGMAVLIVSFGTLGDLVESMLKRSLGAKDSGQLLPGHGGLLDRFDGLLIAAPIVFAYLWLILN